MAQTFALTGSGGPAANLPGYRGAVLYEEAVRATQTLAAPSLDLVSSPAKGRVDLHGGYDGLQLSFSSVD